MAAHPNHPRDRRRWPRVETLGQIVARWVGQAHRLDVPDFSEGGCSLVSSEPVEVGAAQELILSVPTKVSVRLHVVVVSCRAVGSGRFQIGCRFDEHAPTVVAQVGALLDAAMAFSAE